MKYLLLFITYFFLTLTIYAQSANELWSNNPRKKNFEVLPDKGYSIDRVATDTSLHFKVQDSLQYGAVTDYWIRYKLYNNANRDEDFVIIFSPIVQNIYYQYDSLQQKWVSKTSGYQVAGPYYYDYPSSTFTIRRNETQINYILCKGAAIKKYLKRVKLGLFVYAEKEITEKRKLPVYAWLITLVILLLFFLYNLYLYVIFKDKAYFYYLLLQIGAAIYVTASTRLVAYFIHYPLCLFYTTSDGYLFYFDGAYLGNKVGTILVIISFIQLTKHFLSTQQKLPKINKGLKLVLWPYLLCIILTDIGIFTHTVLPKNYLDIENSCLLLIVFYLYYVTWYSYRRNYKPAFYLLIANLVPLSVIVVLIISLLVSKEFKGFIQILPDIAVISQAITFSIALHLKLRNLKSSIHQQQAEVLSLKQQIDTLVQRQEAIAKENDMIAAEIASEKYKNEDMEQKMEANRREMASNAMYMYQKNSLLSYLKGQMKELNKMLPDSAIQTSRNIDASLQNHQFLEADWDKFKLHFENVHPSFFEDLKNKYPDLTKNETRLCAYLHLNMSTKEIAALLNIDPGSVRRAKTRLNKKMTAQRLATD